VIAEWKDRNKERKVKGTRERIGTRRDRERLIREDVDGEAGEKRNEEGL